MFGQENVPKFSGWNGVRMHLRKVHKFDPDCVPLREKQAYNLRRNPVREPEECRVFARRMTNAVRAGMNAGIGLLVKSNREIEGRSGIGKNIQ